MIKWINRKLDKWAEQRLYKQLQKRTIGRHWWVFIYFLYSKANVIEGTLQFKEGEVANLFMVDGMPFQHISITFDCTNSELIKECRKMCNQDIPINMLKAKNTFGEQFLVTYIDMYGATISANEFEKLSNMVRL